MTNQPWWKDATCRNYPANWWDVGDEGNDAAMDLCLHSCPVRMTCLRTAIDEHAVGVIQGGTEFLGKRPSRETRKCAMLDCRKTFRSQLPSPYCSPACRAAGASLSELAKAN